MGVMTYSEYQGRLKTVAPVTDTPNPVEIQPVVTVVTEKAFEYSLGVCDNEIETGVVYVGQVCLPVKNYTVKTTDRKIVDALLARGFYTKNF